MASERPSQAALSRRARTVSQQSLRAVIECNFDGMVVVDPGGVVLFANAAAERLLGRPSRRLIGAQFGFPHVGDGGIELQILVAGALRVAEMRAVEVDWEGTQAFLASLRDVTERKRVEEATSLRLAAIVEQSEDAILAFDCDAMITAWNRGAERLLGHAAPEALGCSVMMLVPEERVGEERSIVSRVLAGQSVHYDTERVRADRSLVEVSVIISPIRAQDGEVIAASVVARDATQRNRMQRRLEELATRDPLTGLLNRRAFETELARAVAFTNRYKIPAALLMLDVDHFKYVNDGYGHALGDAILRRVSDALRHRLRETDVVGRLGGDEFALILPGTDLDHARALARALLDELRGDTTVHSGSHVVRLTASIGLTAIDPNTQLAPEEFLARADIALYEAKEHGRDRIGETDFAAQNEPLMISRLGWVEQIRDALEHNGLVLHEQPITNLRNDAVERAELLIRMRTNHQELVAPALFLPVAERFGQIRAIDRWVIDRALQLLRQPAQPRVCHVNVSGATMTDPELIDTLPAKIAREASDPSRLAFEITETVAIENIEHAHQLIERLAALGCQIVLDDFGSGFGSFYYLKHLRFDSLKIAGEFIKQITTSKTDRVTVQAIVEMARGLEKTTIAECVEDQATLELVRELGVDYAQGHHLGKPEPNDHVDGVDEHAVR